MGLFIISIATRPRVQIDDEVRVKSYVFGTMRPPPPPKKGKLDSFLVQFSNSHRSNPSPHKKCWTLVSGMFLEFQLCIG